MFCPNEMNDMPYNTTRAVNETKYKLQLIIPLCSIENIP